MTQRPPGAGVGRLLQAITIKSAPVAVLLTGLLATNVATLLNARVYDALEVGIRTLLLMFGEQVAGSAMRHSKTAELDQRTKDLRRKFDEAKGELDREKQLRSKVEGELSAEQGSHSKTRAVLDQERRTVSDLKQRITQHTGSTKKLAGDVRQRLARGVARNTAAIPAEAVPYIGIGVTLSMTALDIYDACETMKDLNSLLTLLGQGTENADFCGTKLPTRQEVVNNLNASWETSLQRVRVEAERVRTHVPLPDVRLPTIGETKGVVCPVVRLIGC